MPWLRRGAAAAPSCPGEPGAWEGDAVGTAAGTFSALGELQAGKEHPLAPGHRRARGAVPFATHAVAKPLPGGPCSRQAFCIPDSVESSGDPSGGGGRRAKLGDASKTPSCHACARTSQPWGPALGWAPGGSRSPALLPPSTWAPSVAERCRHLGFDIIIVYIK